jgi:MEMO1 family protein
MIRKPAVAGMFYESDEDSLIDRINWCYLHKLGPGEIPEKMGHQRNIKGLMVPHAGYIYSGPVAAHAYQKLAADGIPETVVVTCPNHTGIGSGVSTMTEGAWETPLGQVDLDGEFARELMKNEIMVDDDPSAHMREHSCEVQLPFIQNLRSDFKLVPICMMMQDLETSLELGRAIAQTAQNLGRDVVVIASTDFTHYQPHEVAREHDSHVLEAIKNMDPVEMVSEIQKYNVTMCGYGPVIATMTAAKAMGATSAQILKYATSGETGGDYSSVVGYGSAVFE